MQGSTTVHQISIAECGIIRQEPAGHTEKPTVETHVRWGGTCKLICFYCLHPEADEATICHMRNIQEQLHDSRCTLHFKHTWHKAAATGKTILSYHSFIGKGSCTTAYNSLRGRLLAASSQKNDLQAGDALQLLVCGHLRGPFALALPAGHHHACCRHQAHVVILHLK